MTKLTSDDIVQRKDDQLIISELDEDLVMMDLLNGSYLSLNRTGRIIWEQIEKPSRIKDIIMYLTNRFGIDEETCKSETLSFLEEVAEQKVLKII